VHRSVWTERGRPAESWLRALEASSRAAGARVRRGGDFDGWDLTLAGGALGRVRVVMALEEHGGGRQLARFRIWPSWSRRATVPAVLSAALAAAAAADAAGVVAALSGAVALLLALRASLDCGAAMHAAMRAFPAAVEPVPAHEPPPSPSTN
jgi:hypothetical protein